MTMAYYQIFFLYIPQIIAGLLYGVEDGLPEPLTFCHGLLGLHLVVLGVGVPSLWHNAPRYTHETLRSRNYSD